MTCYQKRALLVFVVAVALVACSGGTSSKSKSKATTTSTATTTTTNAVAEWKTAHGHEMSAALSSLSTDNQAITADAGAGDLSGAMGACAKSKADVTTIQAIPSFPDSQVAAHLAGAMSHYYAAVTACLSGVSTESAAQIASEFQLANAELSQMNQRLTALGV